MNATHPMLVTLAGAILAGGAHTQRPETTDASRDLRAGWEVNRGQYPEEVFFVTRTGPGTTALTSTGAVLDLDREHEDGTRVALGLSWVDAAPASFETGGERVTRRNYIRSADPEEWITNVPAFDSVTQLAVWNGVDVRWSAGDGRLEYDFELAPGANLDDVRIRLEGAETLAIGPNGELFVETLVGRVVHSIPRVWQTREGETLERHGRFELLGDDVVGFRVDRHDPSLPLIVDPIVDWGTYGAATGTNELRVTGVTIAEDGTVAYTGYDATPSGMVTTPGTYQPVSYSIAISHGYVGKISADGSTLLWATWIGDTGVSRAEFYDIGFLSDGRVAVSGYAYFSADFTYPFTANSGFPISPQPPRGVLTVLSADGADVVYSAQIGGHGWGLDVGPDDHVYVTGYSNSSYYLLATPGAFMPTCYPTGSVPFATRIDIDAGERVYWTYLSSSRDARIWKVAVDDQGRAFFIGYSSATPLYGHFPTPNGFLSTTSYQDLWVGALSADGTDLLYGSYLFTGTAPFLAYPGTGFSPGGGFPLTDIDTDGSGRMWFAWTGASGFYPNTGAPHTALVRDMIVTCIDTNLSGDDSIVWSRGIGATYDAYGGFARLSGDLVLAAGNIATSNSPCQPLRGPNDALVAALDKATGELRYSWLIGGEGVEMSGQWESPFDVNGSGQAVIAGNTTSKTGIVTAGAMDETFDGNIFGYPYVSGIFDVHRDPCGPSDDEPPVVVITTPADQAITGDTSIALGADVVDDSATTVTSNPVGVAPGSLDAGGGSVSGTVALASEGENVLSVHAVDEFDNDGGSSVSVYRDTVAPVVTVAPAEGSVVGVPSVELLVTVSDQTQTNVDVVGAPAATLAVDGGAPYGTVNGSLSSPQTGLAEGPNALTVAATDAAGNTTTVVRTIVVDSMAPVITITDPANGSAFATTPISLTAVVTDDSDTTVTGVVSATLPPGGGTVTGSVPLTEGWNTLGVQATDALGSQASASVSVLLDTTPPTVEIVSPADLSLLRGVVDYAAIASDPAPGSGVASVELLVDGAAFQAFGTGPYETLLDTTTLADGWHTLEAVATDGLGNQATDLIVVQVDNTPPTIVIVDPLAGALLSGDITFSAYAADAESGLATLDMRSGGQVPSIVDGSLAYTTPVPDDLRTSVDSAPATDGPWTLAASATDAAGNAASVQIEVYTDNSAPDKTILSPADGARVSGLVPIDVVVSDPNLDRSELYVDGVLVTTETDGAFTFSWDTTVRDDGDVPIRLVVYDLLGNVTSCTIRVIVDNSSCVELHPETLNLGSKGKDKSITVKVCGYGLEALLPTENADLRLCVPGGSPVPSTVGFAGDDTVSDPDGDGHGELLLKFDRQKLIASIRAGIQAGAITGDVVIVTLKAGPDVLGSDDLRLVGE